MLFGAADEVLRVLKSEAFREKDKKKEVKALLGDLSDERFALLVNLSKKITDFHPDDEDARENVSIFHLPFFAPTVKLALR